jgi:hypothetical protein
MLGVGDEMARGVAQLGRSVSAARHADKYGSDLSVSGRTRLAKEIEPYHPDADEDAAADI